MSKGPGKAQRAILNIVESQGYCILRDVGGFSQPSLSRAASNLERRGLVRTWYKRVWIPGQVERHVAILMPTTIDTWQKFEEFYKRRPELWNSYEHMRQSIEEGWL